MKKTIVVMLAICLLLSACGGQEPLSYKKTEKTVFAMDTVMSLTVYAPEITAAGALDAAEQEIYRLDNLLSISGENGDVYRLNTDRRTLVSRETAALLRRALELSEETGGAFDPTVYPLMDLWGFPRSQYRVPAQEEIDELLAHVGPDQVVEISEITSDEEPRYVVELASGAGIDLGGIAKGYTSERVIETLQAAGVESAIISLGGNVGTLGKKPDGSLWTVAIENPEGGDYLGTLSLDGNYFAITSGGYERYFEEDGVRYHHILDPKTGYPADTDLRSVTIVSQDGTLADALSTALFVKGFDGAADFWRAHSGDFDMVLVTGSGIFATPGLDVSSEWIVTTLEASP